MYVYIYYIYIILYICVFLWVDAVFGTWCVPYGKGTVSKAPSVPSLFSFGSVRVAKRQQMMMVVSASTTSDTSKGDG